MQAYILRNKFLNFFKAKKHKIVESDSLIPRDDPTVLFTPAGMNQFKKEFMGIDCGYKRAATCQRCLRTGDLDKVGKTPGHHTFFEMLGNFSFGDYFKDEAISFAWEFLTEELKIKKENLWVSVYKEDAEAFNIWRNKIRLPLERIIKLGDKENFWPSEALANGPNGPCGPCSEIFFDRGKEAGCGKPDCSPSCDCARFVEVWNLVFTQFNRKDGPILVPLPHKNIDTGMGLERLSAVMQGVGNNFETDLFQPIVKEIEQGLIPGQGGVPAEKELVYAVADHIRAIAFAIYDGALPSNESRGYVVRKLIRKGALNLRRLGFKQPFLYKLVPALAATMKQCYPGLEVRKENIAEIILAEEKKFIATLDTAPELINNEYSGILAEDKKKAVASWDPVAGAKLAFKLYDTYGLPLELLESHLAKYGVGISQEAFDKELEAQKNRSKLESDMKGDVFGDKAINYGVKDTKFLGYKDYSAKAKVTKIVSDKQELKKIRKGMQAAIILDKTPFYPESGGQMGDRGELVKGNNIFGVLDTKKFGKVILHIGKVKAGGFKKNDFVLAKINVERRLSIARNHTATHLLQAALRKVLGGHIRQQGSLVAEDRLRFDFNHFKDIKKDELDRIEEVVNGYILGNYELSVKQMTLSEAKKSGALAFFQEKYDSKARVVSVGDFSKELCAGTHLDNTSQIGLFKITQESSVASGVRRIEAVTGIFAYNKTKEYERIVCDIAAGLNVPRENVVQQIETRLSRVKSLEKLQDAQKLEIVKASLDKMLADAELIKDIRVITGSFDNLSMDLLRRAIDSLKEKTKSAIMALGSKTAERALLVMGVTGDLCDKGIDASKLVREVAAVIGGSGGGRKDFAQAGGNRPDKLEVAFQELRNIINSLK